MVDRALGLVDLTDLVHDHVDLDTLIADVDIDAVAARLDLDAVLDRVDIDEIAGRLDMKRRRAIDLDAILDRVDIDEIAGRLDMKRRGAHRPRRHPGPGGHQRDRRPAGLDAVAATIDLDAVVSRLDLVALAEFVIEGIDLPGIIQSSTGSMASVAAREVRWQGIGADERVEHIVDRMLRRKERHPARRWGRARPGGSRCHRSRPGILRRPGPVRPRTPAGGYGLAR